MVKTNLLEDAPKFCPNIVNHLLSHRLALLMEIFGHIQAAHCVGQGSCRSSNTFLPPVNLKNNQTKRNKQFDLETATTTTMLTFIVQKTCASPIKKVPWWLCRLSCQLLCEFESDLLGVLREESHAGGGGPPEQVVGLDADRGGGQDPRQAGDVGRHVHYHNLVLCYRSSSWTAASGGYQ